MADNKETQNKVIQENLNKTIIICAIILGIVFVHQTLAWIGIHGNLFWFIFNAICTVATILVGLFGLKFLLSTVSPKKNEDQTTFIILIVGLVFAACFALWFASDTMVNLVGLFRK